MYTNLAMGGGAHLTLPFLGFLRAAAPLLGSVRCVSGCSGGALVAMAWVLEVPADTVIRLLHRHLGAGVVSADLPMLLSRLGMTDVEATLGEMCVEIMSAGIASWYTAKKGFAPDPGAPDGRTITMLQLYKLTGRSLRVGVCDVSRGFREAYLTAESHPDLPVWRALCASCAVPIVFTPVRVGGSLLCDPCAGDCCPVRGLSEAGVPGAVDTLLLEVADGPLALPEGDGEPRDVLDYARRLLALVAERALRRDVPGRARLAAVPRWTERLCGPLLRGLTADDLAECYEHGIRHGKDFLALVNKGS